MTYKENIKAILECNFSGFKEEIIDSACERILDIKQEPNTWSLDDAREDFMSDVYNTLDFLPTNNEANRIMDSFDRVTSGIKQETVIDKIRAEIEQIEGNEVEVSDMQGNRYKYETIVKAEVLQIIDKYRAESSERI